MVRFQFAYDLDIYLALYLPSTTSNKEPIFVGTSLTHLKSMSNYCGKAALRRIEVDIYEIYFCGRKLCFNYNTQTLQSCVNNEHNTKWEIQKVDVAGLYLLRIENFCVTLRYGRVQMEYCKEGVDLAQAIYMIQETRAPKFLVSDDYNSDTRKKKFNSKIYDNENLYRQLSIFEGNEFSQGSRYWNINMEQHCA